MGRREREIEGYMDLIRHAVTEGNCRLAQNYVEPLTSMLTLHPDVSEMGAIAAELDQLGLCHTIDRMIDRVVGARPTPYSLD